MYSPNNFSFEFFNIVENDIYPLRAETIVSLGNVEKLQTIVALNSGIAPNFESSNVRL